MEDAAGATGRQAVVVDEIAVELVFDRALFTGFSAHDSVVLSHGSACVLWGLTIWWCVFFVVFLFSRIFVVYDTRHIRPACLPHSITISSVPGAQYDPLACFIQILVQLSFISLFMSF